MLPSPTGFDPRFTGLPIPSDPALAAEWEALDRGDPALVARWDPTPAEAARSTIALWLEAWVPKARGPFRAPAGGGVARARPSANATRSIRKTGLSPKGDPCS